jgi:hypothetical protein
MARLCDAAVFESLKLNLGAASVLQGTLMMFLIILIKLSSQWRLLMVVHQLVH